MQSWRGFRVKFNPVTEYSIPTEELHPLQAYDRGFLHGEEFAKFQEHDRISSIIEALPFVWTGTKKNLEAGRDELIALIKEQI
jgi:hypothetical protein